MSYLRLKKMLLGTLVTLPETVSLLEYLNAITTHKLEQDKVQRLREYVNRSIIHHATKGECVYDGDVYCDNFMCKAVKRSSKGKFDEGRGASCEERDFYVVGIKDELSKVDVEDYEYRDSLSEAIYNIVEGLNLGSGNQKLVTEMCEHPAIRFDYVTLGKSGNNYILYLEDIEDAHQ